MSNDTQRREVFERIFASKDLSCFQGEKINLTTGARTPVWLYHNRNVQFAYEAYQAAEAASADEIKRLTMETNAARQAEADANQEIEKLKAEVKVLREGLDNVVQHQEMNVKSNSDAMMPTTWHIAKAGIQKANAIRDGEK